MVLIYRSPTSWLQDYKKKREWEPEKIKKLEELSKKPDIYERLARALAPSIYENKDVKKGILMQVKAISAFSKNLFIKNM